MLDDSHVITNIIGDRFAALDYCYVLLEESTGAFYALIISLISMHTAVLRPVIQDAMAKVTKPGMYEVTWP